MDITHIEGGKIVESWHQEDILGLMQQLGLIPTQVSSESVRRALKRLGTEQKRFS